MSEMDGISIFLLVIGVVGYLGGLCFFLIHSEEIVNSTNDIAQSLSVEGRLLLNLIYALLIILWPLVVLVGVIKVTIEGKWGEIINKKKPPPR